MKVCKTGGYQWPPSSTKGGKTVKEERKKSGKKGRGVNQFIAQIKDEKMVQVHCKKAAVGGKKGVQVGDLLLYYVTCKNG